MLATVPMDRDLALLMLRDIARVKVARVKTASMNKEAVLPLIIGQAARAALPWAARGLASAARWGGKKLLQSGGGRLARFMAKTPMLRGLGERLGGRVTKSMFKSVDRMKQVAKGGRAVQSARVFSQPVRTALRNSKIGEGMGKSRLGRAFLLARKRSKFRQANKLKWKAKDLQAQTTKGFEGRLPSQLRATGKGKRMSIGKGRFKGRANVPLSGGGFRQSGSAFGNKFEAITPKAITPSNAMESIKSMVMSGGSKGGKAVRAAKFVAGNAASTLPFAIPGIINANNASKATTQVTQALGQAATRATKPANKFTRTQTAFRA